MQSTIKDIQRAMATEVEAVTGAKVDITFFNDSPLRFSMFTLDGVNYRVAVDLLTQTATLDNEETYTDEYTPDEVEYYAYFTVA
jgi:hypothetical protein